jgi:2-octaprenylphenol hydroxylase
MNRPQRIIVVGGGPVGLCVAALLAAPAAAAGCGITVIDGRRAPEVLDESDLDLRVYALSRASQLILQAAGAWPRIATTRVSPFQAMRVWEGSDGPQGAGTLCFDAADIGEPNLGHIVEDQLVRASLFAALPDQVEYLPEQRVVDLAVTRDEITLSLASGAQHTGALLVGADGTGSMVRRLAGIATSGWGYRQRALVTHVATAQPHRRVAYQRFLAGGPVALLPLADGRSSVVWSLREGEARALVESDGDTFKARLTQATGGALGDIVAYGERLSFPLQLLHAQRYTAPRLVLLGDAAHTVHPLAGQGANLGLLDAGTLVDALQEGFASGWDPGDQRQLRRYERQRKGANLSMMLALDGLHRLFGLPEPAFQPLRKLGMASVNGVGPLKNLLIREALGVRGRLPAAARPPSLAKPLHG